ncbi:MAG: class I SAM-dependent methyltransferase [Rubrobacter sp.]|nr:class I SAM-dependent methyltransferase [Rubrobacter sp.]
MTARLWCASVETMNLPTYESIGWGYSRHRKADPRIVRELARLLGVPGEGEIVDVGAGTGNYAYALAQLGYRVVAIEPSATMRRQAREAPGVRWVAASAERLLLGDGCMEGAACVLALHHFANARTALSEIRRVVCDGTVVVFTFDPRVGQRFWFEDYFPGLWDEAHQAFPPLEEVVRLVEEATGGGVEISDFRLPHDLQDKFAAAGWRRPWIYLDKEVRAGISAFALAEQRLIGEGLERLSWDLRSGVWHAKYRRILQLEDFDAGYRFLKALPAV